VAFFAGSEIAKFPGSESLGSREIKSKSSNPPTLLERMSQRPRIIHLAAVPALVLSWAHPEIQTRALPAEQPELLQNNASQLALHMP
jgi:hypothetical protein